MTLTPLEIPRSRIFEPALSPDGRFLAYSYQNGRFRDVELFATNGEHDPIQLTAATRGSSTSSAPRLRHSPSTYDTHAFWARDGRTLLFIRGYGLKGFDRHELWALGIDSAAGAPQGAPFQLAEAPHHYSSLSPTLTPDGEVLFARRKSVSRVHLLAVDPESGEARGEPESDFPEGSQGKHWAPQGMKFYYFDPSVRWQVMSDLLAFRERDVATGKERIHQIPWPELTRVGFFDYSRDHSKGLFVADAGSGRGLALYLFNAETHELSELLALERHAWAKFSNDVKKAAFFDPRSRKEGELKVVDLTRGSVRTLTKIRDDRTWPRWSPDDTEIAFEAANCLYAVPAAGGKAVTIACGPALPEAWRAPDGLQKSEWDLPMKFSWSPGGRMLVWTVAIPEKRRVELWVVDRDTGKRQVAWAGGEAYSSMPFYGPNGLPTGNSSLSRWWARRRSSFGRCGTASCRDRRPRPKGPNRRGIADNFAASEILDQIRKIRRRSEIRNGVQGDQAQVTLTGQKGPRSPQNRKRL